MANILDYLSWRGDLDFASAPINDVDLLVLARLAYAPFECVVPGDFASGIAIPEAAEKVLKLASPLGDGRAFRIKDDETLLRALMDSPRYRDVRLTGYVNFISAEIGEQFSAVTALLPSGDRVIAYRGTDGTLVGWQEDFNMAYANAVPAQLDAAAYAEAAADFDGGLYLCGHSKGGNLAVYAATFGRGFEKSRIRAVRSFDGPGFMEKAIDSEAFSEIMDRTKTILPQSSIIGMLLGHEEDFSIVGSRSVGIFQHNIYYWDIVRAGFVNLESRTNSSVFIDDSLKNWVRGMSEEQRRRMINGVFSVLEASGGTTLRDLFNGKNTISMLRALKNLDPETRKTLTECFAVLKGSMKSALPALIERMAKTEHRD